MTPGGAAHEVGVRAEPGPGRQPRFGGAERPKPVSDGQRAPGQVPDHQGPPRLDLHHERRGPLPGPVPARAAERPRPGQGPRPSAQAARPGGHRAASTGTAPLSSRWTRTRPARRSGRCSTRGSARSRYPCCGPSATRSTSGGCASWSPSRTPGCSSRCPARSAPASRVLPQRHHHHEHQVGLGLRAT